MFCYNSVIFCCLYILCMIIASAHSITSRFKLDKGERTKGDDITQKQFELPPKPPITQYTPLPPLSKTH